MIVSGAPCCPSTDDPDSRLSRPADELEADLLDSAEVVLTGVRSLLASPKATGRGELRFAGVQLAAAPADALRIAASRGERLAEN